MAYNVSSVGRSGYHKFVPLTSEEVDARRYAARRHEITQRILPIVEQRLSAGGSYVTLKVEEILQDASLSRSSFYRYFKDKNELLLALIEPVLDDVRAAAIRPLARTSAPTKAELQADLAANFEVYRPHIPLLNALVEVSYSDPDIRARFQQGFAGVQETIASHIADGQAAGFIRSDLRPTETAAWITWMAERGMTQLVAPADDTAQAKLAESVGAIVWHTLYDD
jgi:TetR/AcrR family transcriptional regulator, ethionamide resistance regulator